jgi:hypothetical protein
VLIFLVTVPAESLVKRQYWNEPLTVFVSNLLHIDVAYARDEILH